MIKFFFFNQLYSKIKSVNLNLLFFFIFIVIIFIKSPCTFFLGRSINGMEVYFYNALNNHFWNNLIYVYSEGKYFELWTNLSAIIHSETNLSLTLIDVYMALVIKIALIYYIFFSHSEFLITTFSRFIFASFSIYSTAVTPEIWLISLHSKNFFGIVSFLMLFQNFTNFDKKNFFVYRFFLVFNGLCSIYSSIFSIIYFLKYYDTKIKINFTNFIYSLIPLIINFAIFVFFSLKELATNDRFVFELDKLFNLIYNVTFRPVFGGNLSKLIYNSIDFNYIKFYLLFFLIVLFFFTIFYILKKKDNILNLILLSFLVNVAFILAGSQYANFVGGRYAVISSIIYLCFFLRLIQIEDNLYLNRFFLSIIFISLIAGIIEFKFFNPWMYLLKC
jgi:hypothetical protein